MNVMEQFSLKGKNVLITGGAGILGSQFVHGLAESGANVAILDINEEASKLLSKEVSEKYQIKCIGYGCDVSSPESVDKACDLAFKDFGFINVLHNNAAAKAKDLAKFFAPLEDYSYDVWREIMSVNIDGMFLMAKKCGKHMLDHGKGGSIVQTASIYGIMAPDQRIYENSEYMGVEINTPAVYSASKGAVIALSRYLAAYWGSKNIRVNTLTPGGVESGQNEEFTSRYSERVPMGRMAHANEMVGALVYLASDASSYVNGQNIVVDGGLSSW
jgi:NAD(P)-dependent dehydrogenase (short-subunit alcohol dehydrogenase family)